MCVCRGGGGVSTWQTSLIVGAEPAVLSQCHCGFLFGEGMLVMTSHADAFL